MSHRILVKAWHSWQRLPPCWRRALPALLGALVVAIWLIARPARRPAPDARPAPRPAVPASVPDAAPVRIEDLRLRPPLEALEPEVWRGGASARELADRAAAMRRAAGDAGQASAGASAPPPSRQIRVRGSRRVWRVDASGAIARSDDGAQSWRNQTMAGVGLVAGMAVSERVCWVVGRSGTVLRTADGERWELVAAPTRADLIQIEARDATSAQITTADGRRYQTDDGGMTWRESGR